jgi:hypothetical protein
MRRTPAVERRSPAPSRPGHHTLCHRVLLAFPVQEAFASSVPRLGPACGPAAMVGGRTPCTAGDALGAGLLQGRHRQLVTTGAHTGVSRWARRRVRASGARERLRAPGRETLAPPSTSTVTPNGGRRRRLAGAEGTRAHEAVRHAGHAGERPRDPRARPPWRLSRVR